MANARRRGNFINSLTVRGVQLDKDEELKEGIGSYFKSLFEESLVRRPVVESGLFRTLDSLDNETLEGPFLEEVSKALSDLGRDKEPGPDGFTLAFWNFFWPIVGGEVMQVFEELHSQNVIFRSLNATFLVLILKKEELVTLISRAEEKGFIKGFKVMGRRGEGVSISHLLFADDTLLFFGGVEDVDRVAAVFGCKVGNLFTTYLGLPLGAPHNSCRVWDVVEERFKRKLATWKKQYLSKGGRLTLIKSTLSNLPIYFMSLFVIPRKVRLRLEKIQREFLWEILRREGRSTWKMALEISSREGEFLEESHCWVGRSSFLELVFVLERVDAQDFDGTFGGNIFGGDKEVEAGVGRCTLEDPSKIGNWRRCNLCKEHEESADHILIHCGKKRELWTLLLSSFGVVWVFPASVRNLLLEWKVKGLGKKTRAVWRLGLICLFWCIWGERNRRTFQEEEMSDTCLRNLFFGLFLSGLNSFCTWDSLSFLNFLGDWLVG
ncbi:hypothetical protein CK203_027744 [Vitis vinifera]|uniref:Reverse transcriptase zinc-binding domain-containing protein n=1 Tax=Vitis vinifera TaxID=29760 RepID=A0A438IH55_VITVI|nr:hypothetical protein CK203_027744 [Vitis vinifera]